MSFQGFAEELAGLPGKYAPPEGRILLALVAEQPAGCVALRRLDPGACEMKRMFVRPEFRCRGLGRGLTAAIIEDARAIGYAAMRLDTLESMGEALALYRSLGFRAIPAYRHNPDPLAVFLELDLSASGT